MWSVWLYTSARFNTSTASHVVYRWGNYASWMTGTSSTIMLLLSWKRLYYIAYLLLSLCFLWISHNLLFVRVWDALIVRYLTRWRLVGEDHHVLAVTMLKKNSHYGMCRAISNLSWYSTNCYNILILYTIMLKRLLDDNGMYQFLLWTSSCWCTRARR